MFGSRELRVRLRDDGRGLEPDVMKAGGRALHWGLPGMRERAARVGAQLDLRSSPETGTEIELRVGAEAVERHRALKPDVTLMDVQMPVLNGIEAIRAICAESPHARIVVLTTYDGDVQALRALQAGACGYLLKSTLRKELLETIRAVHAGRTRIPPDIAAALSDHLGEDQLTGREVEVLRHVASGRGNRQIAGELSISEETVKTHMRSILSKLSANDRTHAVTIAQKRGILSM